MTRQSRMPIPTSRRRRFSSEPAESSSDATAAKLVSLLNDEEDNNDPSLSELLGDNDIPAIDDAGRPTNIRRPSIDDSNDGILKDQGPTGWGRSSLESISELSATALMLDDDDDENPLSLQRESSNQPEHNENEEGRPAKTSSRPKFQRPSVDSEGMEVQVPKDRRRSSVASTDSISEWWRRRPSVDAALSADMLVDILLHEDEEYNNRRRRSSRVSSNSLNGFDAQSGMGIDAEENPISGTSDIELPRSQESNQRQGQESTKRLRSSLLHKQGRQSSVKSLRWSLVMNDVLDDNDLMSNKDGSTNEEQSMSSRQDRRRSSITRFSLTLSDVDLDLRIDEDSKCDEDQSINAFSAESITEEQANTTTRENKKAVKTVTAQNSQVFFMIGCQRSGSNWLRTMLGEREDLIAPHPPHIMRDFMPRLEMYGDLNLQDNLKVLIDHVIAFAERNQVKWLDLHSRPIKFKRSAIMMEVMVTIECFHFKEKYAAMLEGRDVEDEVENPYYLLAIFDAIMNTMAKANGKKMWMCKSMGMSKFHDLLLSFYGKERLRYIYLVRDPRDVCLSFMNTPVGDCHPYAIAKKWANLQNFAAIILHETPDLIHQVCYEEVLGDKEKQVAKIVQFMGARDVCRSMRRGSIVAIKNDKDVVSGAKAGREAKLARKLSYQFKNLGRGESFIAGQFRKWATEMKDEDLMLVESVAFEEMQRLGYEPHLVETEEDRIDFTEDLCEEYAAENKRLIEKMNADLAIENPDDLQRRKIQASVLERTTSEHYEEEFVRSFFIDIDNALDTMDNIEDDKGFIGRRHSGIARFNFQEWPLNASLVGFQSSVEVSERFEEDKTKKVKLKGGITITFAAATQGGYYPNDRDKANQDAYIAGARVTDPSQSRLKKEKNSGVLFAVFDGHGPNGAECSRKAKEHVAKEIVEGMKNDDCMRSRILMKLGGGGSDSDTLDESARFSSKSSKIFRQTSSLLEMGETGIDASHSGTTATSLFITKDFLHTANVGDSRCLLIEQDENGKTSVTALTVDHTPDREDEIKRIEAHGGVVMTSDQYDNDDPTFTSFEQKRIWSKAGKWPGTAFTRSIGDAVAKELGVCAEPECANYPLPSSNATFVLGSDGVFDFVPDEEIGEIVKKFDDPAEACRELIGKAWNRWCDSEERADDITVIVGHVKHRKQNKLSKLRHALLRST